MLECETRDLNKCDKRVVETVVIEGYERMSECVDAGKEALSIG